MYSPVGGFLNGMTAKKFNSISDFLNDTIFDGKRLEEIINEISDVSFDYEP